MQNLLNTSPLAIAAAIDTLASDADAVAPDAVTVAAVNTVAAEKPAKPAKRDRSKPRAKPAAEKPAAPVAVAAPDTGDRDAERKAAREAISAYYRGRSLPFKAASDTFALFRTDKAPKAPTERQAALLAAMLLAGDNINKRGEFKRGGFVHDGRAVQPETGCLSDMHGRVIDYVSGPLIGKQAREAIFRVNLTRARAEIQQFIGDKLGKLAIARLDTLSPPKPAKPAKPAKQSV